MSTRRARNFPGCVRLKALPIVRLLKRIPLFLQAGAGFAVRQICSVVCRNFLTTAPVARRAGIAHADEEFVAAFDLGVVSGVG
jgi:hypothetical protein